MTDVLLLNSPVTTPSSPNLGLPALVAYLRSRHIEEKVLDLNQEFFCWLLSPRRILDGLQHAQHRFQELNDSDGLTFHQSLEYSRLCFILSQVEACAGALDLLRTGLAELTDLQELPQDVKHVLVQLACSPYSSELLLLTPEVEYSSGFNTCCSKDLLRGARSRLMFSECLEGILPGLLERTQPRLVGISAVFASQLVPAFWVARLVKELAPRAHVTLGGAAVSIHLRDVPEKRLFDFVDTLVLDEGERPLELLHRELASGSPDLSRVPGIRYVSGDSVVTTATEPPVDLDLLPTPAYDALRLDRYLNPSTSCRLPLRLSRGCRWQRCAFCRTQLPLTRYHQQGSVERFYTQLREIAAKTGIRKFHFTDPYADPMVLESIARLLVENDAGIDWIASTRVSPTLTAERALLYRRSGCLRLFLGVESFSDRVLVLMNKGIRVKLIDAVIRAIGPHVPLSLYMIAGFPTETREEALDGYSRIGAYKEQGLIETALYAMYEVMYGSDVWSDPARYGISRLRFREGSDLNPDTSDFDCASGMTRAEVAKLEEAQHPFVVLDLDSHLDTVTLPGGQVPLRYDPSAIRRMVLSDFPRLSFLSANEEPQLGDGSIRVRPVAP